MGAIDNVFGATLCGSVAAGWIFGLICVFSFQYYSHYASDPLYMKILVGLLWFLQLFNQVTVTKMIYHYVISNFGNEAALGFATWEWPTFIGIEAVTATMVQMYYAWRIWKLTKNGLFGATVAILSLCQLAFGLGTMIVTATVKEFSKFTSWTWISLCWLGFSAGCDIVVAVIQVRYLTKHNPGIKGTDKLIKTLTIRIVSTGVLTSVAAILEVSTFAALGFNFVHVFISYPNGGLYVLSLLANLHVRRKIRNMHPGTTFHQETRLEPIQFKRPDNTFASSITNSTVDPMPIDKPEVPALFSTEAVSFDPGMQNHIG